MRAGTEISIESLVGDVGAESLARIDGIVGIINVEAIEKLPLMQRTVALARGMSQLRALMSGKILAALIELRDTPLGFMTDRPPGSEAEKKYGAYRDDVVRDALIDGLLRGARTVNNEINIIAGRCYLAKNYWKRRVLELPDVTGVAITPGVPQMMGEKGALVPMYAEWYVGTKRCEMVCDKVGDRDTRIAVRVNSGMGIDAVIGKAEKRMLARIYATITGSEWAETEAAIEPDDNTVEGEVVQDEKKQKELV